MSDPFDDRLRAALRTLRDEERAGTPPFRVPEASLEESDVPAATGAAWRWAWLPLAAVAAAVLWIATPRNDPPGPELLPATAAVSVWVSATDVLLETPGSHLLRPVPTFRELRVPPTGIREPDSLQEGVQREPNETNDARMGHGGRRLALAVDLCDRGAAARS
jgi:hypothetical protein